MGWFTRNMLAMELSDSLVKIVEVKVKRKRLKSRMIEYMAHPFPSTWIDGGDLQEREAFIQTMREGMKEKKFRTRKAVLSLNCSDVYIVKQSIPELRNRRLRKWFQNEILPELSLPFDNPTFDFHRIGHVWEDGGEQEAIFVMTSKEKVEQWVEVAGWLGLEPVGVQLAPLGLYRWLDLHMQLAENVMLLQIAKTRVEISLVIQGNLIEWKSIPLSVSMDDDQIYRPQMDSLKPVVRDEEEISVYGERLLIQLEEIVDGWKANHSIDIMEWVLSGEGIDFSLLQQYLNEQVDTKVSVSPSPENMMSKRVAKKASQWIGPTLSVPLGLALGRRKR
ncbi:type IV pilus biogenesis protein PilM [Mechercharimyces sp. CAU 1602]|uniref:type IV pilus biogenesis protein PilM n=1 Tax=Mechercharimyces sp. CAU 1602 TaxID=2973933 RepID=UPI0021622863|nr:pilus assembly protein PilM [Mechercharimyces sp. CAU 1602]MCS1351440.1 pilus assembly protein PilM [Mechercharimyces sp. CAU 1602]